MSEMANELASYIDHTLLKAEASKEEIIELLDEAEKYKFVSVCVNPYWVSLCHKRLQNTNVKICTVIGFPLGATTTETKVFETKQAVENGAGEVDMVMNIGELKAGNHDAVKHDMADVAQAAKGKALVKVIIETSLLTDDEKVQACMLAKDAGCAFVKTSTGFASGGAIVEDILLMRKTVGSGMGVKASGGVRDAVSAKAMIAAGATRIGASSSVEILLENKETAN